MTKIDGFNSKNKNKINYLEVSSVTKQISNVAEHDLPFPSIQMESKISSCLKNEDID